MDTPGSTHTSRATYEIRQRIVGGQLPGGTRLYEVALADDLNISRTPVREAMSRLTEEGLLERGDGRGFVVRSFSHRDVIDAIELRGVLEGTAVRLAAEQGVTASKLQEIKEICGGIDGCFAAGETLADFDRYSDLNRDFHDRITELCGSTIVLRELERVKSLPFASPSAFVLGQADALDSGHSLIVGQQQHRAMIEAIEHREAGRAEAIAREHARIARSNFELHMRDVRSDERSMPGLALIVE